MCVDAPARAWQWVDADDVVLAARVQVPLLISAATEHAIDEAAREIHASSLDRLGPLVRFRASGFLAQHDSFDAQWKALCEAARGGTMLLTAIDEMPCPAQLRLLESLSAHPGARRRHPRLVTGTTVSLVDRLASGEFSEELFYRLNILHIALSETAADLRHRKPCERAD